MDVTNTLGAARADAPRSPARARAGQGDFDAFFRPAVADEPAAPAASRAAERDAERIDRGDARREQAERRDARRADRREARERADARRDADEARADAPAERAERRRPDDDHRQGDGVEARRGGEKRRPDAPARAEADDESPAGALGLTGLLERLARESKAVDLVEFGRGARGEAIEGPFDAAADAGLIEELDAVALDAERDGPIDELLGEVLDEALDLDLDGELTRLLERERPADAIARALGGRRVDTVRIAGRPAGEGTAFGPAPLLASPHRAVEAAAMRAPARGTLPPGVDESSVLRQISDALRLGDQKNRSAEIALHPAELGRIKVRIAMEGGAARITVGAEHAAVADLLASSLDQLRRDLMAQGVQVSHLEVRSELADQHGEQQRQPEHDETEVIERPEPKPAAPRRRAPRGRIDLKA